MNRNSQNLFNRPSASETGADNAACKTTAMPPFLDGQSFAVECQQIRTTKVRHVGGNGASKSTFYRMAATVKAALDSMIMQFQFFTPRGKSLSPSVICQHFVAAFIVVLDFTQGPIAVLRTIAQSVVAAFDSVFRGGLVPHISVEIFKRQPAFTDSYATIKIIPAVLSFGLRRTATFHISPRRIFRRPIFTCHAVRRAINFMSQTAARLSSAVSKQCPPDGGFLTATTLAQPQIDTVRVLSGIAQNSQPTIDIASFVDFNLRRYWLGFCHSSSLRITPIVTYRGVFI